MAAIKPVIVVGTTHVESRMPGGSRPGYRRVPDGPAPPYAMGLFQSSCLAATSKAHVAQQVEHFLGKEEVHRFDPGRGLHIVCQARSKDGRGPASKNLDPGCSFQAAARKKLSITPARKPRSGVIYFLEKNDGQKEV